MRKAFTYLLYLIALITGLTLAYLAIVIINKVELKPDARYSSISLQVAPSPISKNLNDLMYAEQERVFDADRVNDTFKRVALRESAQRITTADQPELSDELKLWLDELKPARDRYSSVFLEPGCVDELVGWDHTRRKNTTDLIAGAKLIAITIVRALQEQHPDQVVKTYTPLLQSIDQKRRTCHHGLMTYVIFNEINSLLSHALMPVTLHPELSEPNREQLIKFWTQQLNRAGQEVYRGTLSDAMKVEYHQIKRMTEVEMEHAFQHEFPGASIQTLWPFWDEDQYNRWVQELFRAQAWQIGKPMHLALEEDLEIDLMMNGIKLPSVYFSYNTMGQILIAMVTPNFNNLREHHHKVSCKLVASWTAVLKELGRPANPELVNPFTDRALDVNQDEACSKR